MSQFDETIKRVVELVLKHDTIIIGAANMLANNSAILRELLPKCIGEKGLHDCTNPATMTRDTQHVSEVMCDNCVAKLANGFETKEQQDAYLKRWGELPTAQLVRTLNDYVLQVEKILPTKVH